MPKETPRVDIKLIKQTDRWTLVTASSGVYALKLVLCLKMLCGGISFQTRNLQMSFRSDTIVLSRKSMKRWKAKSLCFRSSSGLEDISFVIIQFPKALSNRFNKQTAIMWNIILPVYIIYMMRSDLQSYFTVFYVIFIWRASLHSEGFRSVYR